MENEKNTLQKIAEVIKSAFSNSDQTEQPTAAATEQPATINEEVNMADAGIAVDMPLALPDGSYTVDADKSKFTVTGGVVTEVKPAEEEKPAEDKPAEDETPFQNENFSIQFSAQDEKIEALNFKIEKLESVIKAIGQLPSAAPIVRTETMSTEKKKDKTDLRQYFTSEKDYNAFVQRHTK